jgi:hypothetical protein
MCLPRRIWRLLCSSMIANIDVTSEHVLLLQGCGKSVDRRKTAGVEVSGFELQSDILILSCKVIF